MLGSTIAFAGAAFAGSSSDYAVVYGSQTDLAAATDLANSLTVTGATTTMGSESHLIVSSGDQLQYGEALNDVEDSIKKTDLEVLLADGTVEDEDGDASGEEYDYTQEITVSADEVVFDALDNEDYVANKDAASKELPVLYLDQSADEAWSLLVDFKDDLNAVDLDDSESIVIAGTELTVDPDLELGDDLTMFISAQTVTVNVEAEKTVTVNGKTFTVKVLGANTDNDEATIEINGDLKQVTQGDSVTVDGQKFYINQVFMQTVPVGTAAVEIFAGAKEVTIVADETQNTVEVDGETLDGVEATVMLGASADIDEIESIEFFFIPSDLESDNNEQDSLEIGETIVDPLLGIAMTFKDSSQEMKDDKDAVSMIRSGDHLEVSFTNTDGDQYTFKPYQGNSATIELGDDMFDLASVAGYTGVVDENIIILTEGTDITKILQVKSIDSGADQEVQFKDLATGETFTVDAGDEVLDTGAYLCENQGNAVLAGDDFELINNNNADAICGALDATTAVETTLITETESEIELDSANIGTATVTLTVTEDITDLDDDDTVLAAAAITVDVTTDADDDIIVNNLDMDTGVSVVDKDDDMEYGLTPLGTYAELDLENEGSTFNLYVPEEETDYNVYFSSSATTTTSTSAVPVSAADVSTVSAKNLLVVGGSCINAVAQNLLGSTTPLCGADFSAKSGVGAGQYLIQVFASPYNAQKVAVMIAGYEAAQTQQGVDAFQSGNTAMTVGTKVVGPTLA